MSYKLQFFIDEVLQCLVDKYQITYQINWGECMVRPHLMESSYCKTLGPLKGVSLLHHCLHKDIFSSCCYMKKNFENNKADQIKRCLIKM